MEKCVFTCQQTVPADEMSRTGLCLVLLTQ